MQSDARVVDSAQSGAVADVTAVAAVGDINGDHLTDLAVAEPSRDPARQPGGGVVTILFSPPAARVDLARSRLRGYRILGATGDGLGSAVASAGDVNHDGVPDVLIGADGARPNGRAYVVYGRRGGGDVNLATLTAADGFRLDGAPDDNLGGSVAGLGDLNGDGRADVLVASTPTSMDSEARAYVVYGGSYAAPVEAQHLGSSGYCICGIGPSADLPVAGLGDVNGDRIPDLAVGVSATSGAPHAVDGVYVVFGRRSSGDVDLGALGRRGFSIADVPAGLPGVGYSVSGAGDVNGDHVRDVVMAGGDYDVVVFGSRFLAGRRLSPGRLGSHGFLIRGAGGSSVGSAGDFNHDGRGDVLVTAATDDPYGRYQAGSVHVIYGKRSTAPIVLRPSARLGFEIAGNRDSGNIGEFGVGAGTFSARGHDDLFAVNDTAVRAGEVDVFFQDSLPRVEIAPGHRGLRRKRGRVQVSLLCPATTKRLCAGDLSLRGGRARRRLAARQFRIRAGYTIDVTLRVPRGLGRVLVTTSARSASHKHARLQRTMRIIA